METARAYLITHRSGLYEEIFFTRGVKFQYPVTALLFMGSAGRGMLNPVSWMSTLLTAVISAVILRRALRNAGDAESGAWGAALFAASVFLGLTFYPLVKAYSLGQIQTWLDAAFALWVLCWMGGYRGRSGVLLGFMCLIKPTFALLLGWAVVRREWGTLLAAVATFAIGSAVAIWRYGGANVFGYLRVLSFLGRRGEAFYPNQSFNGVLNRLVGNGSNLEWRYFEFPAVHPAVVAGSAIALVVLVALAWFVPAGTAGEGGVVDLCLSALTATVTAPIAWEHHYGIMLPMYAAVTPRLLLDRPFGAGTIPALAVSFVAAANFVPQANRLAATALNPLQSYLLGSALLMLALMYSTVKGPTGCVQRVP